MSTNTEERVDLSDLDLLDDETAHARCTYCYPGDVSFKVVVALCGTEMIQQWDGGRDVPPNACEACQKAWYQPCSRCGR